MLAEERRSKIVEILKKERKVIAKDLADLFHISIDSIRRDLSILEDQGMLKKAYGGAIIAPEVRKLPLPEKIRYGEGTVHHNGISKLAISYIQENETVFIGGAGIHYGMIKYLPSDISFTVVTNSMKVAETIRQRDNLTVYIIGGKLRPLPSSGNIIDTVAVDLISQFSLDTGFLTGGGISTKGISTATTEGARFTRAVSDVSRKKICLAPHEKLSIDMFARAVSLKEVDLVITDEKASEKMIDELEGQGVEVIVAPAVESD
ncbi:DeoR/GlpR family DNA-binding transcription regulator [Ornithinibacillus salinisoli]|uniref:DeoR/GlpR family DNA-binding transcription regulator n=1 Tax=Ornithinibacillus salinisoli TaxID=1848459 RepID=A0ABW4W4D7_9BACI